MNLRRPWPLYARCMLHAGLTALASGIANASHLPAIPPAPLECAVPDALVEHDTPLKATAERLRSGAPLKVLVLGTGSVTASGMAIEDTFPMQFASRLRELFPKAQIEVVAESNRRMTAQALLERLRLRVEQTRPTLVVWQTGTVDAVQRVPLEDFNAALDAGIEMLLRAGIDVMLMGPQFSPQTAGLVDSEPYRRYLMWAAQRADVPLFTRHALMEHWSQHADVDLASRDRDTQARTAVRIHRCLGVQLARAVALGVRNAPANGH